MTKVNFDIKLSESQQEIYKLALDKKLKYITVVFSRQSGKTVLMMVLCIQWLMGNNCSIAYVCRNFTLAKKLYRDLIRILPNEIIKTSNGSDFYIESVFGSRLNFYSAEQGNSLRGQTFTHMICDEFAFFKQEQTDGTHLWNDILSPTLKARGKKCIFVSTPLNKSSIFYEMYQRGLSDEYPNYASVLKTIYDDGFITKDEIEEIKKGVPDLTFRREYLCEWMDDGISFFQGFADCFDIDRVNDGRCWIGIDISGDGNDATIVTSINGKNEVKQYEVEGTLDMKYRIIANLIDQLHPTAVYGEINGIGSPFLNEIKKLVKHKNVVYDWTTTNSSKEEIISNLAVEIANKNIHFERDNIKLFNELSNFIVSVSKTRKLTFAAKGSGHDDRVLSLAIALRCKNDFPSYSTPKISFVSNLWTNKMI